MSDQGAHCDAELARIAAGQHGVVSASQLRERGIDKHAVRRRVRAGRLHPMHRGVYAVGHPAVSQDGRWMAAVLAVGGVLSHGSAAALWGLLRPIPGPVEILVPSRNGRHVRSGIRIRRTTTLAAHQVTRRRGIPVTDPARTIAHLSRSLEPRLVRRATREAEMLGFALGLETAADRTRSELEYEFLKLCHQRRLPRPEVNVPIGAWTVDFLWRPQGLVVETDGFKFHAGRTAFEDDRKRDLGLRALGYDVVRLTYRQVTGEGDGIAALLRRALDEGSNRRGPGDRDVSLPR